MVEASRLPDPLPGALSGWLLVVAAAPPATHALSLETTDWPSRTQQDTTLPFLLQSATPPTTVDQILARTTAGLVPSPALSWFASPRPGFSRDLRHGTPVSGPAPLRSHLRQIPNRSLERPTAVPLPHVGLATPLPQNVGPIGGQGQAGAGSAPWLPAPLCPPPVRPLQPAPTSPASAPSLMCGAGGPPSPTPIPAVTFTCECRAGTRRATPA